MFAVCLTGFRLADTITYFCNTIGTLRAGATAFLVSTRNGAAAVADMMQRTGAEQLFVSPDVVLERVPDEYPWTLGTWR